MNVAQATSEPSRNQAIRRGGEKSEKTACNLFLDITLNWSI
jgi:hypothetical protein